MSATTITNRFQVCDEIRGEHVSSHTLKVRAHRAARDLARVTLHPISVFDSMSAYKENVTIYRCDGAGRITFERGGRIG